MTDIAPLRADHLPGDLIPRSIVPQQHNPLPRNTGIPPSSRSGRVESQWEDVVPPVVQVWKGAVQDTVHGPQYINAANNRLAVADYPEPPGDPAVPFIYPNVGPVQGVPEYEQVIFPDHQRNNLLGYAPRGAVVSSPTQAAFPDTSTHRPHPLSQPAVENLRRLASRCVHHPDSQVEMVRMEPGSAGRYKVVIVLEMPNFL